MVAQSAQATFLGRLTTLLGSRCKAIWPAIELRPRRDPRSGCSRGGAFVRPFHPGCGFSLKAGIDPELALDETPKNIERNRIRERRGRHSPSFGPRFFGAPQTARIMTSPPTRSVS